ncbi:transmembrane protein 230-like isoform X3 [Corticium candelabrum]|uniref:transmembrane protein 230-like isoform X3 n=1 Tax=Corticium candelabrum TaxID=121492 RepID=UPI002E25CEEA|nr:transmembrane protein 230-like isoform X3 [Corticium candelabrum]
MSGRKGKYDYHRLREERTYTDAQFRKPAVKVPVKAIGLAVMLFLVGSVLLILGSLLATGSLAWLHSDCDWQFDVYSGIISFLVGIQHVHGTTRFFIQ